MATTIQSGTGVIAYDPNMQISYGGITVGQIFRNGNQWYYNVQVTQKKMIDPYGGPNSPDVWEATGNPGVMTFFAEYVTPTEPGPKAGFVKHS